MTAEQQAQIDGFNAHLAVAGVSFVVGGVTYYGLICEEPMISPEAPLGQDDREIVSLDFIREKSPALSANQRVEADGFTFQILKREEQPGDKFTRYWAVKV